MIEVTALDQRDGFGEGADIASADAICDILNFDHIVRHCDANSRTSSKEEVGDINLAFIIFRRNYFSILIEQREFSDAVLSLYMLKGAVY